MRMIFPAKADSRPSRPCILAEIIGIEFALQMPVTAEPQFLTAQTDITYPSISKARLTQLYIASQAMSKFTAVLAAITTIPITNKPESWLPYTVQPSRALAAMIRLRDCGQLMR